MGFMRHVCCCKRGHFMSHGGGIQAFKVVKIKVLLTKLRATGSFFAGMTALGIFFIGKLMIGTLMVRKLKIDTLDINSLNIKKMNMENK